MHCTRKIVAFPSFESRKPEDLSLLACMCKWENDGKVGHTRNLYMFSQVGIYLLWENDGKIVYIRNPYMFSQVGIYLFKKQLAPRVTYNIKPKKFEHYNNNPLINIINYKIWL